MIAGVFGYVYYSKYKVSIPKVKFFEYIECHLDLPPVKSDSVTYVFADIVNHLSYFAVIIVPLLELLKAVNNS